MSVRDEFDAKFDRCFLCGIKAANTWPPKLETHEISRGPSRKKSLNERAALIRTCQQCHSIHLDAMPISRQLAIKKINDSLGYDRQRVNILRDRAVDAVTEGEVMLEVCELQDASQENGYLYPRHKL